MAQMAAVVLRCGQFVDDLSAFCS